MEMSWPADYNGDGCFQFYHRIDFGKLSLLVYENFKVFDASILELGETMNIYNFSSWGFKDFYEVYYYDNYLLYNAMEDYDWSGRNEYWGICWECNPDGW